jgi:DNA-binding CsgD family transcriptional regulator
MNTHPWSQQSQALKESDTSLSGSYRPSAIGFLITDASLKPLSANQEAIAVLTYSQSDKRPESLAAAFESKLRTNLLRRRASPTALPKPLQFSSGRRSYFCRAFLLDSAVDAANSPSVLLILERCVSESMALSQVVDEFRLTRREQEAVGLLVEGLSNKEMADRMKISENTVKALLRLLMAKMKLSSRAGVVATMLTLMMSRGEKRTSPSGE